MRREEEFLTVLESHKGILYKIANSYCQRTEDRKDLVQEMVFQLWRSFDRYNSQYKYSTWIYRIALNVAISFYRMDKSKKNVHDSITEAILNIPEIPLPEDTEYQLRLLQQHIAELKELDKALMLLYLEEKSYKEMADIMGISESNVATRISRIKAALTKKFAAIKN